MWRVITEPSALTDIAYHHRYLSLHARTAGYADRWYGEIEAAILGLSDFPLRFQVAPEDGAFDEEIRHRIVGSYG